MIIAPSNPRISAIAREVSRLNDTLAAKNADDGDSVAKAPRLAPGVTAEQALLVRLGDKINRLETLLAAGPRPMPKVAESIRDTMQDLAGYAVLWLAATAPSSDPESQTLGGDT